MRKTTVTITNPYSDKKYSKRTTVDVVSTLTLKPKVRQCLPLGFIMLLERVFSRRKFHYEYDDSKKIERQSSPNYGKRHYQTYVYRCQKCGIEYKEKSRTLEGRLMLCLNADCDGLMMCQGILGQRGELDESELRSHSRHC